MTDIVSPEVRSRMMAANRRRDTKPELAVRRYLHGEGFRYRLDVRKLPGSPDLVLARYRAAVFVHGCYWHRHEGCRFAYTPKSNVEFWTTKFERNVERDAEAVGRLIDTSWRVATIWECALRGKDPATVLPPLATWISGNLPRFELPPLANG